MPSVLPKQMYYLGLSLCLLWGCEGGLEWEVAIDADPRGGFWASWGATPEDIFVVGGQVEEGIVLRGSHLDWEEMALPENTPLLDWVHGTSSNDVWVGGIQGTLMHWNGQQWEDYSLDIEEAIWGIYASSTVEVYAVGGFSAYGGTQARAFYFNGAQWEAISLPGNIPDANNLFKVHDNGDEVWLVGSEGALARGRFLDFQQVPSGVAHDLVTAHSPMEAATPTLVVGGTNVGTIYALGPDDVEEIASTPSGLFGVYVQSNGNAIVSGFNGYTGYFDSTLEIVETIPSPTSYTLHNVNGHEGDRVYAVGGDISSAFAPHFGTILTAVTPK